MNITDEQHQIKLYNLTKIFKKITYFHLTTKVSTKQHQPFKNYNHRADQCEAKLKITFHFISITPSRLGTAEDFTKFRGVTWIGTQHDYKEHNNDITVQIDD